MGAAPNAVTSPVWAIKKARPRPQHKDCGVTGLNFRSYMIDIRTVLDSTEKFVENFDHQIKPLPRSTRTQPTISNLTTHRWLHPILTAAEEAELVRRARTGDRRASEGLVSSFHRLIVKIAGKRWRLHYARYKRDKLHTNDLLDDLVGAGMLGLWESVRGFDSSVFRFSSRAIPRIAGAISDEATHHRMRGVGDGGRIGRWLFNHPHAKPENVLAAQRKLGLKKPVYHSLEEAADAICDVQALMRPVSYGTTTESGSANDEVSPSRVLSEHIGADRPRRSNSQGWVPAWYARQLYGCLSSFQLSPYLLHHNPPGWSRIVDELAEDADRRAARRLKEIGDYALELVDRKPKRWDELAGTVHFVAADRWRGTPYSCETLLKLVAAEAKHRSLKLLPCWAPQPCIALPRPEGQRPKPRFTVGLPQYELDAIVIREKTARLKVLRSLKQKLSPRSLGAEMAGRWRICSGGDSFVRTITWEELERIKNAPRESSPPKKPTKRRERARVANRQPRTKGWPETKAA